MIANPRSAVVIGGGIIGLACACRLLQQGIETRLISPRETTPSASWGNAGHLAYELVEPLASWKSVRTAASQALRGRGPVALPLRDAASWLPFLIRFLQASGDARFRRGTQAMAALMQRAPAAWRRLAADIGRQDLLVENGHFIVWESARSAARGRTHWHEAETGPATCRNASTDELAQLTALTGMRPAGAIRFDGTGQVADPGLLLQALRDAVVSAGGSCIAEHVNRISIDRDRHAVVETTEGSQHAADAVVIAAGVASGALLAQTGMKVPLIAERGYHIQASTERWPAGMPPVVFEDRALIATRFGAVVRATGFLEFARHDRPPCARHWDRLETSVAELNLPFDGPLTRWMGARPTLPDYLPAIGATRPAMNLYYAFGHQHLGLTLAPVTADCVTALVTGHAPALDITPFDLLRFSHRSSTAAYGVALV